MGGSKIWTTESRQDERNVIALPSPAVIDVELTCSKTYLQAEASALMGTLFSPRAGFGVILLVLSSSCVSF